MITGVCTMRSGLRGVALLLAFASTGLAAGLPGQPDAAAVAPPATPGAPPGTMQVDGIARTYRFVPAQGLAAGARAPLIVALHGGDSTGAQFEQQTRLSAVAPPRGVAVVYPDAVGRYRGKPYWNDGRMPEGPDDTRFIAALIDDLAARGLADPQRVYVTGFSNGASMTNKLAAEITGKLAAIAPVAGTIATVLADRWRPQAPLPVLYFHGVDDPFAYYVDGGSAGTRRGSALPAERYVHWWSVRNGCAAEPAKRAVPDASADSTTVEHWRFERCRGGVEVQFYKIAGGGHQWPGGQVVAPLLAGRLSRDIDASVLLVEFFLRFRRAPTAVPPLPAAWLGAGNLDCQWHHRALAYDPADWTPQSGKAYGEDSNVSYFYWGYPGGELPEGTRIVIEGEFPYSRHFQFQVTPPWDPAFRNWRGGRGTPLVPLLDEDIEPLPGHVNPFRPGADRYAVDRSYRVSFVLRAGNPVALNPQAMVPPYRAAGNTRIGGHRSGRDGSRGPYIEIRMYAPDRYDPYGGVALPRVTIERPGAQPELAPPVRELYFRDNTQPGEWLAPYRAADNPCHADGWAAKDLAQWELRRRVTAERLAALPRLGIIDPRGPARTLPDGSVRLLKAFGINRIACTTGQPLDEARRTCPEQDLTLFNRGPDQPAPGNDEHTNGWHMYNSYLFGFTSFATPNVLAIRGRAPQVPATIAGTRGPMPAAPELRYWSLCLNAGRPTVIPTDCLMDENVALDARRDYLIVVSAAADRPANARAECGISWLPLRTNGAQLVWRFMSTAPQVWPHALQNVSWHEGDILLPTYKPDVLPAVLGPYFPRTSYSTRAGIEALGCPVGD